MAVEQIGTATFRLDNTRSARDSSELDDQRDGRAHKRVDPVRNGGVAGLKGYWEIHFAIGSHRGETEVREVMKIPLGRLGRAGLALIGKFPAEEMSSNLRRFKELM